MAGSLRRRVSSPPSTSRVTLTLSPSTSTLEAKVPWAQPSRAASIWPVWLLSSSIACLPRMTIPGCSSSVILARILATASGSTSSSVWTRIARSAPIASAVRKVSCALAGPIDTATTSVATPFSLRRVASSTAISSNGFMLIFTLARSIPEPSILTRGLTLKSITRLTATSSFILSLRLELRRHGLLHFGDDLLRRVAEIVGGDDRQPAGGEDVLALLHVGALEADDQRHVQLDLPSGRDDALGDDVAAHDAAEDVDEDALHRRIRQDDLERRGHLLLVGAAADIAEI